jgi:hypothetical protein
LYHYCTKRIALFIDLGCYSRVVRWLPEGQEIDLSAEILRRQVAIDLCGDARIAVAKDPLHSRRIRTCHH